MKRKLIYLILVHLSFVLLLSLLEVIIRDIGFFTYTNLFQDGVCPVLDFATGVWGHGRKPEREAVHKHTIRYVLDIQRFATILAITGDMGWVKSEGRLVLPGYGIC